MKLTLHERLTGYKWYYWIICRFTLVEWFVIIFIVEEIFR
jgi:hypothetical protein